MSSDMESNHDCKDYDIKEGHIILFKGFPPETGFKDIEDYIKDVCEYLKIKVISKKSNFYTFAFVYFENAANLQKVLQKKHYYKGIQLETKLPLDRDEHIKQSVQDLREPRKIFVDKIPKGYTANDIKSIPLTILKIEGLESDHLEMVNNMTADELFDSFDDFCHLDFELPHSHSYYQISDKPPQLNIGQLTLFNILACNDTKGTASTKDSSSCSPTKFKKSNFAKQCFSDFFSNSDDDSKKYLQKCCLQKVDDLDNVQEAKESIIEQESECQLELEKHSSSTQKDPVNSQEGSDDIVKKYQNNLSWMYKDLAKKRTRCDSLNLNKVENLEISNDQDISKSFIIKTKKQRLNTEFDAKVNKSTNYSILSNFNESKPRVSFQKLNPGNKVLSKMPIQAIKKPIENPKFIKDLIKGYYIEPNFKLSKNIFKKPMNVLVQKTSEPYATNLAKKDIPFHHSCPTINPEIRKTKPVKIICKPQDYLKSSATDQTENLKKSKNFTSLPNIKQCHMNLQNKRKKNVGKQNYIKD